MTGSDGLSAYSSGNNLAFKPLTYFTCKAHLHEGIHLFHFSHSLCSMRVRQALEVKYFLNKHLIPILLMFGNLCDDDMSNAY